LLDEARNILKSWSFVNAWPVKWAVSDLNSDNKIMIESLELAYGSFQ
jgi:phage tail-like protein